MDLIEPIGQGYNLLRIQMNVMIAGEFPDLDVLDPGSAPLQHGTAIQHSTVRHSQPDRTINRLQTGLNLLLGHF